MLRAAASAQHYIKTMSGHDVPDHHHGDSCDHVERSLSKVIYTLVLLLLLLLTTTSSCFVLRFYSMHMCHSSGQCNETESL